MSLLAGAVHINLTGDNKSLNSALDESTKKVKKLGDQTDKTKDKSNANFDKIKEIGVGAMMGLGVALAGFGVASIKSASQMQNMGVSLKTAMGGSQEATDAALKTITDFAAKTPYALGEVQGAFVKLKNMGLDPSTEALTAYGDTASAMGKSLNDMVEAVADAATGEFERLKEFGIRSSSEGDRVKFTFKGVTTEVGKNSEEIQKYLKDLGKTNFGGGMEAQSKTLTGTFSTFSDTIQMKLGAIATKSGILDKLTEGMTFLGTAIDKIDVEAMGKQVENTITQFNNFGTWIKTNEQPLTVFGIALGTITLALTAQSIQMGITTGITGLYTGAMGLATGATTALTGALAVLTSPIGIIILVIGAVIAAGYLLVTNWDFVKQKAGETWNWIKDQLKSVGVDVDGTFKAIDATIKFVIGSVSSFITRNMEGIQQTFGGMVKMVSSLIKGDFSGAIEGAKEIIMGLGKIDLVQMGVQMIQGLINGVGSMAGALWNKITELANSAMNALKGALGIKSPSVVFQGFGVNTVEGFNLGIDQKIPELKTKMDVMAQYTMKPFGVGTTNNSSSTSDNRTYNTYNNTPREEKTNFGFLNTNYA